MNSGAWWEINDTPLCNSACFLVEGVCLLRVFDSYENGCYLHEDFCVELHSPISWINILEYNY